MGNLTAFQIVLLILAGMIFVVAQYLTFRRGIHYARSLTVDGDTFTIQMHYQHRLPCWFKVRGFAMGGHAWMFAPLASLVVSSSSLEVGE